MKEKIKGKIGGVIENLENEKTPLLYYIGSLFFILILRNLLEVFSYKQPFSLEAFAHYNLSFVFLILVLVIIFHFATEGRINKIARAILSFSPVILIAPVVDLLTYGYRGYQITYFLPAEHGNLVWRLFTFFGRFTEKGISLGIKIEVLVVLLLSFGYFLWKNRNIAKSLFFTFLTYIAFFSYFSTAYILKFFLNSAGMSYTTSDLVFAKLFLILIFVVVWPMSYLAGKKYLVETIKDVRPFRLGHFLLMLIFGLAVGVAQGTGNFSVKIFFDLAFIMIALFFAWLFSVFVNNISDLKIDAITNRERPLVAGSVPEKKYKVLALLFLLLAVVYSLGGGAKSLIFTVIFMGNYFLYSMPPLRLKKIPMVSKLPISVNSLLLVVLGYSLVASSFTIPFIITVFFLTLFTLACNFIDLKDYEGDKKEEVKTLPVLFGLKRAKILIGTFFALAVFSGYFIVGNIISLSQIGVLVLSAALAVIGFIQFYLINRKEYDERPVFVLYLVTILTLLCVILLG